ncbi:MAG: tetratricopeptide repeat protein [Methylocystis sp.]|nr:tetratricopeptide repeat protein [Methylocystis sp.]MCA3583603.1 tetratricopeptide repeat protein [Methylocystis sp.]MCA3586539.1 tetratricopeptide repeat protein [Methylocystis sp.]MCA3593310.1 tetratricopeptide repeat protein [Methylocystis sp.]
MRLLMIIGMTFGLLSGALAVGPEEPKFSAEPDYAEAEKLIKTEAYAKALPLLVKLDKAFPNEPELLNWLGFTHRKLKNYPVAKVFYDRALKIDPLYKPALEYQGMWFVEMGDIPSAKANLEQLRKICAACEETKDLEDALKQAGH